jgi:hypothetical protein
MIFGFYRLGQSLHGEKGYRGGTDEENLSCRAVLIGWRLMREPDTGNFDAIGSLPGFSGSRQES